MRRIQGVAKMLKTHRGNDAASIGQYDSAGVKTAGEEQPKSEPGERVDGWKFAERLGGASRAAAHLAADRIFLENWLLGGVSLFPLSELLKHLILRLITSLGRSRAQ
jgi:hypothetical protein